MTVVRPGLGAKLLGGPVLSACTCVSAGAGAHSVGGQVQWPELVLCTHTGRASRDGCRCGPWAGTSAAVLAGISVLVENREGLWWRASGNAKICGALSAKSCRGPRHLYWPFISSVLKAAGVG